MTQQAPWAPGAAIVYREIAHGKVWTARPVTVIEDTPERVALCLWQGTTWWRCAPPAPGVDLLECKANLRAWRLEERVVSFGTSLLVIYADNAHATHLMWNPAGDFLGWYVNLQEPLRRTALGFDFLDQELDIVVQPGREWAWKDEDHLARAEAIGLYSPAQTRAIRAEGQRVIDKIEARAEPFDDTWLAWRPPAGALLPVLPYNWGEIT